MKVLVCRNFKYVGKPKYKQCDIRIKDCVINVNKKLGNYLIKIGVVRWI